MSSANNTFDSQRTGTGTRQWSDHSVNCVRGCEHDCRYCYAATMHRRFGRGGPWPEMVLLPGKVLDAAKRFDGVVMFPTTHDITPSVLQGCLQTLRNLLAAGNEVLVVSKPHLDVIKTLCKQLRQYRERILFRFTIGSLSPSTCQIWEPGAPAPMERIAALQHAFEEGFRTSVSIEPMLGDNREMCRLVAVVAPFATDTVWLGKLNGAVVRKHLSASEATVLQEANQQLRKAQSDPDILELVKTLNRNPKVRWKDSILRVLARHKAHTPPGAPGSAPERGRS